MDLFASGLAPSPHQTFGSGASDSAKILIANTTSGIIETSPISRACWRFSPSLPSSVAPDTTSQPVTLYAGSLGCNPPLSLDFRYYGRPTGQSECDFTVRFEDIGAPHFDFGAVAIRAAKCTTTSSGSGEVFTYAPK
jgi:hypothetical protein